MSKFTILTDTDRWFPAPSIIGSAVDCLVPVSCKTFPTPEHGSRPSSPVLHLPIKSRKSRAVRTWSSFYYNDIFKHQKKDLERGPFFFLSFIVQAVKYSIAKPSGRCA